MIFKFRGRLMGGHYHVRVFAGVNPDALGKSGDIVLRPEEWAALNALGAVNEVSRVDYLERNVVLREYDVDDVIVIVVDDTHEDPPSYNFPLDGPQFT